MREYAFLAVAIVSEAVGTASLKLTDGFTNLVPSVVVAVGYLSSFYFLNLTLQDPDERPNLQDATGRWPRMSTADAGIYARESDFLDRFVQFGAAGEKIIQLSFPTVPDDDAESEHDLLDRIEAYLNSDEDDFRDVDVGLTVPTDHRSALEAVREIPYGEQGTVEQVTRMAGLDPGDDESQRTVREALAENPVPLLVPDHRVRDGPSGAPPEVEQQLRSIEGL